MAHNPALLFLLLAIPFSGILNAQTASLSTISVSSPTSPLGAPVTLTATVSPSSATGKVTFYDEMTLIGTRTLASGSASLTTSLLPIGSRKLTAYYLGDGGNAASRSNTATVTVTALSSVTLASAATIAVATGPRCVITGDFNGDGKVDLAMTNTLHQGTAGTVSILLGNGNGSFQAPITTAAGIAPYDVAAGDFNGDGRTDLAVAIMGAGINSFGVLLGNGNGTFQAMVTYGTGAGPMKIAVADFNGDGIADIVTAAGLISNPGVGGAHVHLGRGDGTFNNAVEYPTGSAAQGLLVADFNNDGKADIAVANASSDTISILLGNGNGTFASKLDYSTIIGAINYSPYSISVGDFNADGRLDLVLCLGGGPVAIALGNADGTFQGSTWAGYVTNSYASAVGDVNGDGKLDIIVTSQDGSVAVLPGSGNGAFQPSLTYPAGAYTWALAVADFNGDGATDVAAANLSGNSLSIFLGASGLSTFGGTPQTAIVSTAFATPLQAKVTDRNGAGMPGITVTFTVPATQASAALSAGTAITDATGVASVAVIANAIAGNYNVTAQTGTLTANFALTNQPARLTITPLSEHTLVGTTFPLPLQVVVRDGAANRLAGITVNFTAPASGASAQLNPTSVFTDSFGIAQVTATANNIPGSYVVTVDVPSLSLNGTVALTNDSVSGIVLSANSASSRYGDPVTLTATVAPANAGGKVTFYDSTAVLGTKPVVAGTASIPTIGLPVGSRKLRAYFGGDGVNLPSPSSVLTHQVNALAGYGWSQQSSINVGHQPLGPYVADLNGDGVGDLIIANSLDSNIGILLGNGDGTFRPQSTYATASPWAVAVADFNGDGKPDVVVSRAGGGYLTVFHGNGDGTLQAGIDSAVGDASSQQANLTVADFNGDGKADVAVVNCCNLNTITVVLGNGNGTFQPPQSFATDVAPGSLAAGDFNGDGIPDLAVGTYYGHSVSVLLGWGNGAFHPYVAYPAGVWPDAITIADFNNDGTPDIAVSNLAYQTLGTVDVLLGNGNGTFQTAVSYTMPTGNPISIASGDFNGDGKVDLVMASTDGSLRILTNSGTGAFTVGAAISTGCHAYRVVAGEFDGNGVTDLAFTSAVTTCGDNGPPFPNAQGLLTVLLGASPTLAISKTHLGVFVPGQSGAGYTLIVSNRAGSAPTSGTVTVTEIAPLGLTLTSFSGNGWTCSVSGATCTRSDALAGNTSYPPITAFFNISANAPSQLTNQASVTGGGSAIAIASDTAAIGCTFTFYPILYAPDTAGSMAVDITTGAACPWTAVSNSPWLTTTSSGTGSGTVHYSVAANPTTSTRSGTLSIGGQTFTVVQGGAALNPSLRFVPVTPCRIADTRVGTGPFGGPALAASVTRNFNLPAGPCGIPATAAAYSLNLTVVPSGTLGFLSVWPAGQPQPLVSTLNSLDGRIKANSAIVPAGTNGAISLFATDATDAIIDINGYFVPAVLGQNLAFYPVTPCRMVDTRIGTGALGGPALAAWATRTFPVSGNCGIPSTAQAYVVNMTVVPQTPLGFLTVWPAGSAQPGTSTLNALTGAVTSNMAIVPAGAGGGINVVATDATDLIIDVNGYFAPPGFGSLDFYPVTPCRIADTRLGTGALGGPIIGAGLSRSFVTSASSCNIPATARALSLNATVVPPGSLGYLSLWGEGSMPTVSTLNAPDGSIVANAAILPAGTNALVTAFVSDRSHLILDTNGYFR